MRKPRLQNVLAMVVTIASLAAGGFVTTVQAQSPAAGSTVQVDRSVTSVELIHKTSRLLHFNYDVPELVIDNQNVVRATPIAADQVLLTALKPGIATITVSDADGKMQSISVLIKGDVRALEMALRQFFPNSPIRATALETGVVLSGTLARADDVNGAIQVASEFFPKVHNNLKLPNSQMIAIEVQIYEVARTKVRELGLDWTLLTSNFDLSVVGAANPTNNIAFTVVNNGNTLNGFLQALERRALAKLLDKPILVTMNGRPAEFLQGGEIPFEVNQGLGNVTIQFRPFGTKLDVVPIVQGEGTVRLEVRAEVSEPDTSLANNSGVAGFRVRRVNTGVDMKIGHTLALAGDIREETEAETRGIPHLMDIPYFGSLVRRVEETTQEIELVILMTPRFIGEVDPSLMPAGGPGRMTVSPSDCQLYDKAFLEVPRCGPDCGGLPNQPADPMPGQSFAPYGVVQGQIGDQPSPQQRPADWQQTPQQAPANNTGFGYPGQRPAQPATPRTGSRGLKQLFRR